MFDGEKNCIKKSLITPEELLYHLQGRTLWKLNFSMLMI
jgi:hypothetical protein